MQSDLFRRSPRAPAVLRVALAVAGALVVAACDQETMLGGASATLDQAGATLSGRIPLEPLKEQPPAGRVTVQMLPFSGLPVTTADAIYRKFRVYAQDACIDLVHRLDEPALWRVQGQFVALGHSSSTTILYTYDVYDAAGRPVHRIVGQDMALGVDGDAWGAVDGAVQDRLAKRAVHDLQTWLNRNARRPSS
ncbi:MAG: hypothetical protein GX458_22850 [Phyllobacteriaceae bacterium]|nr:hypothetical protein [Phyllobacteriaceae bacterium]